MTPSLRQQARRETVALTRQQVETICYEMGWEPEDAEAFWKFACREDRDPGCLEREHREYCEGLLKLFTDGGQS